MVNRYTNFIIGFLLLFSSFVFADGMIINSFGTFGESGGETKIAEDDFERATLGTDWGNTTPNPMLIKDSVAATGEGTNYLASMWWQGAGTFTTDQYSEVEFSTTGVNSGAYWTGATCRNDENTNSSTNSYYLAYIQGNPRQTKLSKKVAGTFIELVTPETTAWADGDILRIECTGVNPTKISVFRNGIVVSSAFEDVEDSDLDSGPPGVSGGGNNTIALAEAWEGGNL